MNKSRLGMCFAGLVALPLMSTASPEPLPPVLKVEKLEWLATAHDVRYAMQTSRGTQECLGHGAEHSR